MKIIQLGKPLSETEARVTCAACKTVFEFTFGEGEYFSDQRDGDYVEICCPHAKCKSKICVAAGNFK